MNCIDWKIQVKTKHGLELKGPLHEKVLEIIHRYKGKNKRFVFDVLPEKFNVEDDQCIPSIVSVEKTYAHLLQESAEVDLEKCMKEAFEKR